MRLLFDFQCRKGFLKQQNAKMTRINRRYDVMGHELVFDFLKS